MLDSHEIPMVAAHWLTASDSSSLRELAGLGGSEGWLIDQLWPKVLSELRVDDVKGEDAWDLALSFLFAALQSGDLSIEDVMDQVLRAYVENGYPAYLPEAARLYGLDDELQGGWGRTSREVLAEAEGVLIEWARRRALRD